MPFSLFFSELPQCGWAYPCSIVFPRKDPFLLPMPWTLSLSTTKPVTASLLSTEASPVPACLFCFLLSKILLGRPRTIPSSRAWFHLPQAELLHHAKHLGINTGASRSKSIGNASSIEGGKLLALGNMTERVTRRSRASQMAQENIGRCIYANVGLDGYGLFICLVGF